MKSNLKSLRQIDPEDLVGSEWAEWYRMTPAQRWSESGSFGNRSSRSGARLIPNPILRVLSSMRTHRVRSLLMRGQACVWYGAAEFSRDGMPSTRRP